MVKNLDEAMEANPASSSPPQLGPSSPPTPRRRAAPPTSVPAPELPEDSASSGDPADDSGDDSGFIDHLAAPEEVEATDPEDQRDKALIRRFVDHGDQAAADELFTRHVKDVRRICFHQIGPHPDIEDTIQQAMLEIFRSLPRFRGASRFTSWMFRVCLNVCSQSLRRRPFTGKDRREELTDETIGGISASALHDMETRDDLRRALEIIQSMTEKRREVFILAQVERLGAEEIAARLGTTVSAVWSRLHQARQEFERKARGDPHLADYFRLSNAEGAE